MWLSSPWDNSIDIIDLKAVTKIIGINPTGLSDPWSDSLVIIAF